MPLTAHLLLCELRPNPIGIDQPRPRLSYELAGEGSGQVARQIQASLTGDWNGDLLWDSGRVESSQTLSIPYEGPAVAPATKVLWRVKVWDDQGEGPWSEEAFFVTGLGGSWPGEWITSGRSTEAEEPPSIATACWIRHPDDSEPTGPYRRLARFHFTAPAGVTRARLVMSGDDQLHVWINGTAALAVNGWSPAQSATVTPLVKEGPNEVTAILTNFQGTGSMIGLLELEGDFGKVTYTTGSQWQMSLDESSPWVEAHVSGDYGCQPWGAIPTRRPHIELPAACFRKEFDLVAEPRQAWLFVTGLGVVDPFINGSSPTEAVLIPGWTDYHKRVHCEGMDAKPFLKKGRNCLAAILGDGWHSGYLAFTGRRRVYEDETHLRMALVVDGTDGSRQVIGTDGSWAWAVGEVRENDLLMGTRTDLTLARPGWNEVGAPEEGWTEALESERPLPIYSHPAGSPRRQRVIPGAICRDEPNRVQADFGRNIVGWVRFRVRGTKGQEITVRHAEMKDGDDLYTVNLRSARATDVFVLADEESAVCEPRFTFHGFRYAEITSDQPFELEEAPEAVVVFSDMPKAFTFESGNPLLDGLIQNSRTSLEGNGVDLFTDCPQRDERAGWTGDAQVYARTGHYLGRVGALTEKYLVDLLQDTQREDGALGDVAPHAFVVGYGNAGWEDAGIIVPWQHWWMTGETAPLHRHWDAMVRFNNSLQAREDERGLRPAGSYGDWLLLEGLQHSQLLATLYSSLCALRLAEMAEAIGKPSEDLRAQARERREAVLRAFQQADGRLVEQDKESQSFYALFLNHPLTTDPAEIQAAGRHLARLLEARGGGIATGFLGTSHILPALEKAGMVEKAYQVLLNEDFPGWLFQVKNGATSMWERWDSWHPEKGFQDAGMNSFNHFWIGCVAEWMMEGAAGIRPAAPGFAEVEFAPQFTKRLPFVRASCHTVRGEVASSWEWQGDSLLVKASLPPGVKGSLRLAEGARAEGGPATFTGRAEWRVSLP